MSKYEYTENDNTENHHDFFPDKIKINKIEKTIKCKKKSKFIFLIKKNNKKQTPNNNIKELIIIL